MITRVLALVLLGFAQQSAPAQPDGESKVRISQAGVPVPATDPSRSILAPQISASDQSASAMVAEPPLPPNAGRRPVPQIAKAVDARGTTPQLAPQGATAAAPPNLSQPSQGRDTRAAALKGKDRCSEEQEALQLAVCARVIETRSAEFPIPDHEPLSPEQRLLADQNLLDSAPLDLNNAARRLSSGREDETLAGLAVANLALGKPVIVDTKKEDEAKAQAPSAIDALVAAIVQQANGGAPPN
ncbi:MAG TPA: hypothetical protein DIU09_13095 [Hyphomonadaceae bacterium]|nr:hypothetical protein AEM38_10015 [Hyphomonadaceae bacterium UKL13-1]HCP65517.1 hypothetical protein [Hyphomonadaceae bacterium]